MDDLYNKIEQLRKALSGMKPKQASPIVPALKLPSVKPLSMPSVSSSGTSKIPGMAPPSNKDPKKMAEQLKNPRPKKPKTEMIKFEKNGQWSMVKGDSDDGSQRISETVSALTGKGNEFLVDKHGNPRVKFYNGKIQTMTPPHKGDEPTLVSSPGMKKFGENNVV